MAIGRYFPNSLQSSNYLGLVWILAASFIKLYSKKYFDQFLVQFRNLFFQFVFFGIVLLAISGLKEEDLLEPFSSCLYLLLFFISSLIVRFIAIQIMAYFIRKDMFLRILLCWVIILIQ